jgi:hypothetical protein
MVESSFSFFALLFFYFASIMPDCNSLFFNNIGVLFFRITEKREEILFSNAKIQTLTVCGNGILMLQALALIISVIRQSRTTWNLFYKIQPMELFP